MTWTCSRNGGWVNEWLNPSKQPAITTIPPQHHSSMLKGVLTEESGSIIPNSIEWNFRYFDCNSICQRSTLLILKQLQEKNGKKKKNLKKNMENGVLFHRETVQDPPLCEAITNKRRVENPEFFSPHSWVVAVCVRTNTLNHQWETN